MECEGGTIPEMDELVRTKEKPEEKDKTSVQYNCWRNCYLTQEALREPIVACGLGLLYNKESVLQYLENKTPFPEASAHIQSIEDVKTLKLTKNPAFDGEAPGYIDDKCPQYICPITRYEFNGSREFCFSWECGCVVSEEGFRFGDWIRCVFCVTPYERFDIVRINPSKFGCCDIRFMKKNIAERKAAIIEKKNMKKEPVEEVEDIGHLMPLTINIDAKDIVLFYPDYTEDKKEELIERLKNYEEYTPIRLPPVELVLKKPKRSIESAAGSSSYTNGSKLEALVSCTTCRKLEAPVSSTNCSKLEAPVSSTNSCKLEASVSSTNCRKLEAAPVSSTNCRKLEAPNNLILPKRDFPICFDRIPKLDPNPFTVPECYKTDNTGIDEKYLQLLARDREAYKEYKEFIQFLEESKRSFKH